MTGIEGAIRPEEPVSYEILTIPVSRRQGHPRQPILPWQKARQTSVIHPTEHHLCGQG